MKNNIRKCLFLCFFAIIFEVAHAQEALTSPQPDMEVIDQTEDSDASKKGNVSIRYLTGEDVNPAASPTIVATSASEPSEPEESAGEGEPEETDDTSEAEEAAETGEPEETPHSPPTGGELSGDTEEELPDTPDDELPDTPDDELPDTPDDELPDTPDDELPDTPEEELSGVTEDELPDTPEDELPDAPEEELPDTPEGELSYTLDTALGTTYFNVGGKRPLWNTIEINGKLGLAVNLFDKKDLGAYFGFERDVVLLNRFFARARFSRVFSAGTVDLEAGLALGIFNVTPGDRDTDPSAFATGLSARLVLKSPNENFLAKLSLDLPLDATTSYIQKYFALAMTLRFPNKIFASLSTGFEKSLLYEQAKATENALATYSLSVKTALDIPFDFSLSTILREMWWKNSAVLSDPYKPYLLDLSLGIFFDSKKSWKLFFNAEGTMYAWTDEGLHPFMLMGEVGLDWNF